MISDSALQTTPQSRRREDFAVTIGEVLRLGWRGHFAAAQSVLLVLEDTRASSAGERALCRALLALLSAALEDVETARRLALHR